MTINNCPLKIRGSNVLEYFENPLGFIAELRFAIVMNNIYLEYEICSLDLPKGKGKIALWHSYRFSSKKAGLQNDIIIVKGCGALAKMPTYPHAGNLHDEVKELGDIHGDGSSNFYYYNYRKDIPRDCHLMPNASAAIPMILNCFNSDGAKQFSEEDIADINSKIQTILDIPHVRTLKRLQFEAKYFFEKLKEKNIHVLILKHIYSFDLLKDYKQYTFKELKQSLYGLVFPTLTSIQLQLLAAESQSELLDDFLANFVLFEAFVKEIKACARYKFYCGDATNSTPYLPLLFQMVNNKIPNDVCKLITKNLEPKDMPKKAVRVCM